MEKTLLLSLTNNRKTFAGNPMTEKMPLFPLQHTSLKGILNDHKLASLGDAYVNFVYSLALSKKKGEATGTKVNSHVLSQALKKATLRELLPKKTDRHTLADAAEALIVYAWVQGEVTIEESVTALLSSDSSVKAFSSLLSLAKERLNL
jgi:hypothetical protein